MEKIQNNSYSGLDGLIQELLSGEYQRDVLPNSAFAFKDERQALYFSNLRKNLQSDMAQAVITSSQHLEELELLSIWSDK